MSNQLNLNMFQLNLNTAPTGSQLPVSTQRILDSCLDQDSKSVYLGQLMEFLTIMSSFERNSVEYFVARQQLDQMATDFYTAVEYAVQQQPHKEEVTKLAQRVDKLDLSQ
ncbi:hypothetical protein LTR37_008997 [Vermiconidia calcicola]|uniref:Uncharacterized protein n=1 Tax=Vermiconidia calcicola TaxID=1690605 RepID=A0ACC3NA25_9PEZI|nr:hypothetical protein LTR37_008997 [Vermiconidia calcicola]